MVSTPVTYAKQGLTLGRMDVGNGLIPDEGEIVSHEGVRRVDGWVLCHLRFVLVVVRKDKSGRWHVRDDTQLHGKVMSSKMHGRAASLAGSDLAYSPEGWPIGISKALTEETGVDVEVVEQAQAHGDYVS